MAKSTKRSTKEKNKPDWRKQPEEKRKRAKKKCEHI